MKAWLVREKDEFGATVVFAESAGKAKSIALTTDCCEDANFCDIEVRRVSQMDKYFKKGKTEMDWFNPNDRIALVRDCGFGCFEVKQENCNICPAKEYCDYYNDFFKECKEK